MGGTVSIRKTIAVVLCLLFMGTSIMSSSAVEIVSLSPPSSRANWLYVGVTGPNNYRSIQTAINNASNYYTIFVYNGTYYEHVVVNKTVTIKGQDRNTTIIDGNGTGDVVLLAAYKAAISGFTVRNSGDSTQSGNPDAGIYVNAHYTTITGNDITSNRYGIFVYYSRTNGLIADNRIVTNRGDGILLFASSGRMTIVNNTIEDNNQAGKAARGGIWIEQSNNNIISGNFISNNSGWGNILMTGPACYNNIIKGNIITKHAKAFYIYSYCQNNHIHNNSIINSYIGLYIKNGNNYNTIHGNMITQNQYGIWFDVYSSVNNSIFHNNFKHNYVHAIDPYINIWDNGYPSGGNYWDDYTGVDNDGDHIGDTPYNIPGGNNKDYYPLMGTYGPPNAVFTSTIHWKNVTFNASGSYDYDGSIVSYSWDFDDTTNGTGMTINHSYLDYGTYHVVLTVTDDEGRSGTCTKAILINAPPVFGAPAPANGSANQPLNFTWSIPITDPNGDRFAYTIQSSNGQTTSGAGQTNGTKSLLLPGLALFTTYTVWVNATDPRGSALFTRAWYSFTTRSNTPPDTPYTPTGAPSGKTQSIYTYQTSTIDPDADTLYYQWDWGDGTQSDWLGPFASGANASADKSWSQKGDYTITVKAKDQFDAESDWSEALTVYIVEPRAALLIGLKKNTQDYDDEYLMFSPGLLIVFPSKTIVCTSGTVLLQKDFKGHLGRFFVIAFGTAALLP